MQEEIWKDIEGYEGMYQVSSIGRVRSVDRYVPVEGKSNRFVKGSMMKLRHDKDGYHVVCLRNIDKKSMLKKVHRLVACAFLEKIDGKTQVDHINSKRDDNRVENLRYCTCKENQNYLTARKNKSIATALSYVNNQSLRTVRANTLGKAGMIHVTVYKDGNFVNEFNSQTEAALFLGVSLSSVSACVNGRLNNVRGYVIKKTV